MEGLFDKDCAFRKEGTFILEKFEHDGETYYYNDKKFYDSSFIEVDRTTLAIIAPLYFDNRTALLITPDNYISRINELISCELYARAIDTANEGIRKFPNRLASYVMPMITSCYRKLHDPNGAIEIFEIYKNIYPVSLSSALLTSIAAAYCDIEDYTNAKKYADHAYAASGGKCSSELHAVYGRIEKESKKIFFNCIS